MARILGILALILVIGGAAIAKTIPEYDGEPVTAIVVHKEARKMFLMHDDTVLRSYTIGLGSPLMAIKRSKEMEKPPKVAM